MEGGHGRDLRESRAGKGSHGSPDKKAMSIKAVAEAQRPGEGDNCGAGEEGLGLQEGWGRCSVWAPASLWLSSPVRAALAAEGRGVEVTWWQPLRGLRRPGDFPRSRGRGAARGEPGGYLARVGGTAEP